MAAALPAGVRRRVVEIAADRLGALAPDEVPPALRPFARFAPARRARLAAMPIAAALETDTGFRDDVAETVRSAFPEVAAALEAPTGEPGGATLPAADPLDVAAVAYLLRSDGWESYVDRAAEQEQSADARRAAERSQRADDRRSREAEQARRTADAERERLRDRLSKAAAELEQERARTREAQARLRAVEAQLAAERTARDGERTAAERAASAAETSVRRLTERLTEAESTVARLRRDSREVKEAADVRRWLLLDTLARSVKGLRDELALPPPQARPADTVAAGLPAEDLPGPLGDGPEALDALLALPQAHLVVDGYNVTKTGYPELALADQRNRLVTGLSALAARTGAEVTCVFDGADVGPVPVAPARGVRVRFSPPGQIADELIRRLVRAEPAGRPVTVCSADREVVDGVRRSGARTVTPTALLARLERG